MNLPKNSKKLKFLKITEFLIYIAIVLKMNSVIN